MKFLAFASIIVMAVMAGSAITLRAEDGVPMETPLFVSGRNFDGLDDRIFPLGWSAGGEFAWICMESNEAADECTWLVTIQDMGTNKAVAAEKFVMDDAPAKGIARLWDAHGKAITDLLEKHAIKRTAPVMDHFPLVLGKRRNLVFLPVIETTAGRNKDLRIEGVKSFRVFQSSSDKKAACFHRNYDGSLFPFGVALAGCFVSPDETHAAVVITSCWRGWEGAPHPRKIEAMVGSRTGLGD